MFDTGIQSPEAAARADRDRAALDAQGLTTGQTFFAHGTALATPERALSDRAAHEALPLVGEAMEALRDRVLAEDRRDVEVNLRDAVVDWRGDLALPRDMGTLAMEPRGFQSLGAHAPDDLDARLRGNVNSWAAGRDRMVKLRTRRLDGAARSLYAAVTPKYQPFDLDEVAATLADAMPPDARCRVRYDGERARVDVQLHNPHHFDGGKTGTVGELHRLVLRVQTADDGSCGFRLRWAAERIRCVNLTLLHAKRHAFSARHTRKDLAEVAKVALAAEGAVMEGFAATWRQAWVDRWVDQYTSEALEPTEVFRRLVAQGAVRLPGLKPDECVSALLRAYSCEEDDGGTRASILNACTRAAHEADTRQWKASSWADDEVEEQAGELLYARLALVPVPAAKAEKWGWA